MENHEPTNADILGAVNEFSTKMDQEMSTLKSDVSTLKSDVSTLKSDVSTLKSDVSTLKADMGYVKSNMVTKDHLDRTLATFKGDLILILRKEDVKLRELISILREKKVLTVSEASHILSMEPFPELILGSI